jgi:hypothetical protein
LPPDQHFSLPPELLGEFLLAKLVDVKMVFKIARVKLHYIILELVSSNNNTDKVLPSNMDGLQSRALER